MSEPVVLQPKHVKQVVVELDGRSHATGLREIADWLDTQDDPCLLQVALFDDNHGPSLVATVDSPPAVEGETP